MRVLFLSSWFPSPPDNGAKIRIYHLLRGLAKRHQVSLISFADPSDQPSYEEFKLWCRVAGIAPRIQFQPARPRALLGFLSPSPRSLVYTYSPQMASLVRQELARETYDVVVASQIDTARYVSRFSRPRKILEEVETTVIREAYRSAHTSFAHLRARLTWAKTKHYLRRLLRQFDACTVVSEQERSNLREIEPAYDRISIVPNGVDVEGLRRHGIVPQPFTLIYNGALTYTANYDAMRFFLDEIWNRIRAGEPSTRLRITGGNGRIDLSHLALDDHVSLTGYLPDIGAEVGSAWACVVPLRIGGGTRLKILEAMAMGTPVVATSKGAEGLDVTSEDNILIADDPAEFAAQTLRLLRNPDLRERLAVSARQFVEAKHDWQAIGRQFNQLVESVSIKANCA